MVAFFRREATPINHRLRSGTFTLAVGTFVAAVIGITVWNLHHDRETAIADAETLVAALARSGEAKFSGSLRAIDLLLQDVVQRAAAPDALEQSAFGNYLATRTKALEEVRHVAVIGADGLLRVANIQPNRPLDFSDRVWFKHLQTACTKANLHVSEPVRSKVNEQYLLPVARPICSDRGEFRGVAVATIELDVVAAMLKPLVSMEGASAALVHHDNRSLFVRYPDREGSRGQILSPNSLFARHLDLGRPAGVYRGWGEIDGADRLIAFHNLTNYPISVGVTAPLAALIDDWRRHALEQLSVLGFLCTGFVGFAFILRRREIADMRIRNELELAETVYARAAEGIIVTDTSGTILSVNPAFTAITGYTSAEAIGKTPRILKSDRQDETFYSEMWRSLTENGAWEGEIWNRRKSGEVYLQNEKISTLHDEKGRPCRYISVFSDVTELWDSAERLRHHADHDSLTGLPNRRLFEDRLGHALESARRTEENVAVMFLDLDRFKRINDSLGHTVGDDLLTVVAERLAGCLRKSDTIARFGGDEFAIVLSNFGTLAELAALAQRLIGDLAEPISIDGHEIHMAASIGISVFPEDGENIQELMKNADAAMFRVKGEGRNGFRFFDRSMNERAIERLDLEGQLRSAVASGGFELHYQPKVKLPSGLGVGVEALIRWRKPDGTLVPPAEFIPLAEETGMILEIGEWALAESCRQMRLWRTAGVAVDHVAVNVSARQFSAYLVRRVAAILAETGLDPESLELEITESLVMRDPAEAAKILGGMRDMGVTIAIDDFGTGYSSLAYLKRLPINAIKIDRSFVRDIGGDGQDEEIVSAIAALAKVLNLSIVAEGVERPEQARFLADLGCDLAQGYMFAKPQPPESLSAIWPLRAIPFVSPDFRDISSSSKG